MLASDRARTVVVVLAGTAVLAACSSSVTPGPALGQSLASSPPVSAEPGVPTPVASVPQDEALEPGRYSLEFGASADPHALPLAVVDVPAGFKAGGRYEVFSEAGGFRHLSMWVVSQVVEDPCQGPKYVDPGPSVQDLVDALTALPVWRTSTPKPATIYGHQGLVMDFDVPDPIPVGCEELYHWVDDSMGTQAVDAGKRQRLWILDVDGQRVVVMAGYFPAGGSSEVAGVTPAQTRELLRMAEALTFATAPG